MISVRSAHVVNASAAAIDGANGKAAVGGCGGHDVGGGSDGLGLGSGGWDGGNDGMDGGDGGGLGGGEAGGDGGVDGGGAEGGGGATTTGTTARPTLIVAVAVTFRPRLAERLGAGWARNTCTAARTAAAAAFGTPLLFEDASGIVRSAAILTLPAEVRRVRTHAGSTHPSCWRSVALSSFCSVAPNVAMSPSTAKSS